MILSRDVNQSTGYNLQSDTVDMQSIFLFASSEYLLCASPRR